MALLYLLLGAVSLSDGFNIDLLTAENFTGNEEDYFGYRLLQYQTDTNKQLIVSAPLSANRSGAIFNCPVKKECNKMYIPDSKAVRFFGMSMAVKTSPSASLTSCSPSFTHECDGNSYLNGMCYQFNSRLEFTTNITTAFQECTKSKVNLVFLFDGSHSMTNTDFSKNKEFIWDIMTNLKNSSIEFAAVQFSRTFRTVFTFKDYVTGSVKTKLDNEQHMKRLTNTHGAINYVLKELFDNVKSGADPGATKALVIITDGAPTDNNYNEIQRCEERNIARFIIGVGNIGSLDKLKALASEPKHSNIFMIENYKGLNGLLDKLQNKIYSIEGVKGRKFKQELSQSGFSIASDTDSLILGAVGADDWAGTLYEVSGSGNNEMEFRGLTLNQASYNGYSVAVGRKGSVSLVFSGAPRSNHRGQVTVFRKTTREWEAVSNIMGEQIGCYFGGAMCVLDLDSNSNTDFLIVGAPLYYSHHPQFEGRIYIYRLTEKLEMEKVLEVCESPDGRFGMSLAAVADLNGDQLQDLVVGAPLEENQQGAVYIYLGNHEHGIRPQYTQRIVGGSILKTLHYLGLALDGVMDMGQDGLTDIAVGAKGTVLLLKSRPVVSVSAELSFSPSELNLTHFDCSSGNNLQNMNQVLNFQNCFMMKENTKSKGAVKMDLIISWELTADAMRQDSRAFFTKDVKTSRSLGKSMQLGLDKLCFKHTIYMPRCVKDTVSPVVFRLNFKQSDPQNSTSILNIDSSTTTKVEVPFQMNCKNTSCVSDLQLDFSFLNQTLLVVDQASFITRVTLVNKGDDSFNTSLVLFYPPGLSLSVFKTIKPNRRSLSSCGDRDEGALNKTTCSISLPVYHKNMHAIFEGVFRISRLYNWDDRMQMTLVASSDNNENGSKPTLMKTLPVQFSVDLAISPVPELSVIYLNFSLEDRGPKPVSVVYRVSNLGLKGLPVELSFRMTSQTAVNYLELHNFTISVYKNLTACDITLLDKHKCPGESCAFFKCRSFLLDPESAVQFVLSALITFPNKQKYTGKWSFSEFKQEDEFNVSAQLDFNKTLYQQLSSDRENDTNRFDFAVMSVKAELVIPPDVKAIGVSGGVGGLLLLLFIFILLLKCGFFKHKRHENEAEEKHEGLTSGVTSESEDDEDGEDDDDDDDEDAETN